MSKIVTTFSGKTEKASNCRFILGQYYIKNEECFLIEGQWYRVNSPNLFKDYEYPDKFITKKTIANNGGGTDKIRYGIVDGDHQGKPVLGYFSTNRLKNIELYSKTGEFNYVISESVLNSVKGLTIYNGIACFKEDLDRVKHSDRYNIGNIKRGLPYRASQVLYSFLEEYNKYTKESKYTKYPSNLLKYSFGFEIETDQGVIPEHRCYQAGLMGLRDGSIRGIEYATIPLKGGAGLNSLIKAFEAINLYTKTSQNNSMHIHLGGFPRKKETIAGLYTLLYQIQEEIYKYFPYGYRNTARFKQRDYCAPLPQIKAGRGAYTSKMLTRFNSLYEWLSGGVSFYTFNLDEHPADKTGDHKWNVEQR